MTSGFWGVGYQGLPRKGREPAAVASAAAAEGVAEAAGGAAAGAAGAVEAAGAAGARAGAAGTLQEREQQKLHLSKLGNVRRFIFKILNIRIFIFGNSDFQHFPAHRA